jgi:DNA-directed RNA polymerase specialized sigma24 family protein
VGCDPGETPHATLPSPENDRQVIIWRQMENLSFEEMAARLDRSVEAVRKLWWRAIKQLEQELGDVL